MRVYLAGPINGCTDGEAKDWRAYVAKSGPDGCEYVDPMARDYRGVEDFFYPIIVEKDKEDILSVDVVVAYCPTPSVGTSMEIFFAYTMGKTVITVVPSGTKVSPWLRVHSDIVLPDFGMAIQYLKRLLD